MAPELVRTFVVVKPSEHDAETGMANPAKASVVSCMAQGVVRIRNEIRNRSNEYTVDGTSAATASPNENYEQLAKPLRKVENSFTEIRSGLKSKRQRRLG